MVDSQAVTHLQVTREEEWLKKGSLVVHEERLDREYLSLDAAEC